jgi:hypothetical protein
MERDVEWGKGEKEGAMELTSNLSLIISLLMG